MVLLNYQQRFYFQNIIKSYVCSNKLGVSISSRCVGNFEVRECQAFYVTDREKAQILAIRFLGIIGLHKPQTCPSSPPICV